MMVSQSLHLRTVSTPPSQLYLYTVHGLPQVAPTYSLPSQVVLSCKPPSILLTLLKSTLAGTFVSVASKRLTSRLTSTLTPLDATLTKNRGEGGSTGPSFLLPAICVALLVLPLAKAQEKLPPPHRVSQIEVYESSEELHEERRSLRWREFL
jgi:hypothetical protein